MNLNQVTLLCRDLEKSCAFYQSIGLQLIVKTKHYARFECPHGESTFSLEQAESVTPGSSHLYFECKEIDQRYQELTTQGIQFLSPPEDKPWKWREAWFQDPDGYTLCLFYAGEHRKNPPWRLTTNLS